MENSNGGAGAAGGDNPQPTNVHQQPGLPASLIQQQQGVAQPPGLLQPPAAPGPMYYHQYQQQPAGYPSAVPFQPHQQPQGFYPAAPMMYHQGAPPTAPPVQGAFWQAGPACHSPSNYPGSMFTAQAGPSTSGAAEPPRRRVGRPPGSRNKRPRTEEPSVAEQGTQVQDEMLGPDLPEPQQSDKEVPEESENCWVNCDLFRGLWIILPCGHHGFCYTCLKKEKDDAAKNGWREECLACDLTPTGYLKGYPTNQDYNFLLD